MRRSVLGPGIGFGCVMALVACGGASSGGTTPVDSGPKDSAPDTTKKDAGGKDAGGGDSTTEDSGGGDAMGDVMGGGDGGGDVWTDAGGDVVVTSDGSTEATTGNEGGTPGTWTAITLMDETGASPESHAQDVVTGIWFQDLQHGVVSLVSSGGQGSWGALESMTSPTHISGIALSGHGSGFDGQDDDYHGLIPTPVGVVALTSFGQYFVSSANGGKSFTSVAYSVDQTRNVPAIWISEDTTHYWHWITDVGVVYNSKTALPNGPSATADWSAVWDPEGTPQIPDPIPAGDCQSQFHQGYFADDSQKVAWVSPDGKTQMFVNVGLSGVCRSTDSGANFLPIEFPNTPTVGTGEEPYVLFMWDATHGIAAHANDYQDGGSYVYYTADAGATWTAGTLPASINVTGAHAYLSSGFGSSDGKALYLIGSTIVSDAAVLLLKSVNGGADWTDISAKARALPAGAAKFHTGFAFDKDHIWIGGDYGSLMYSATGGE